jgi:hypothetical protein
VIGEVFLSARCAQGRGRVGVVKGDGRHGGGPAEAQEPLEQGAAIAAGSEGLDEVIEPAIVHGGVSRVGVRV